MTRCYVCDRDATTTSSVAGIAYCSDSVACHDGALKLARICAKCRGVGDVHGVRCWRCGGSGELGTLETGPGEKSPTSQGRAGASLKRVVAGSREGLSVRPGAVPAPERIEGAA